MRRWVQAIGGQSEEKFVVFSVGDGGFKATA